VDGVEWVSAAWLLEGEVMEGSVQGSTSREETLEDRVTRLLGEAHALAQNGDIEDALDLASVAYADWYEGPSDV